MESTQIMNAGDAAALAVRVARAHEEAAKHVDNAQSETTKRTYKAQWEGWATWCRMRGIPLLPVSAYELIVYLTDRSLGGAAPASIRLALSVITSLDMLARVKQGEPPPVSLRHDPIVVAWFKGWAKEHPIGARNAASPLSIEQLEKLLLCAQERGDGLSPAQHIASYARDRCLILMGVGAALRVSDVVALRAEQTKLVERGLLIQLWRSKNDQLGRGHERLILPQGKVFLCPVNAYRAWMRVRGEAHGPLFVGIERNGTTNTKPMDETSIRRMVTRRARVAGLPPSVTSHSLRASFATLAAEQGKSITSIADQGGWRSLDVVRRYIRHANLHIDNPTSGLLG